MNERRRRGYWNDFGNVENEIGEVVQKIGHFPSPDELEGLELFGLSNAIKRYGGYVAVRLRMGFDEQRKPNNYWSDWRNVETELQEVIDKLEHFPTQRELNSLQMSGLTRAIQNHGGFSKVRQRIGHAQVKRPDGYWDTWDNLEIEIKKIISELGRFPTQGDLKRGNYTISTAIQKHGGTNNVMRRMGYESEVKPRGYWQKWDNVEREVLLIMDQLGHFPNPSDLDRLGRMDLENAINRHHGGTSAVRKKLGQPQVRKPSGHWKDWTNLRKELEILVKGNNGMVPSLDFLRRSNSGLTTGIYEYHGGYLQVCQRLLDEGVIRDEKKGLEKVLRTYVGEDKGENNE